LAASSLAIDAHPAQASAKTAKAVADTIFMDAILRERGAGLARDQGS
jgi:hypothetical protein